MRQWLLSSPLLSWMRRSNGRSQSPFTTLISRMYDARKPKVPDNGHGSEARQPHPERPGRRTFQDWIDLTTQIVREVYASVCSLSHSNRSARAACVA